MSAQVEFPSPSRRNFVSYLTLGGLAAVAGCAGASAAGAPAPATGPTPPTPTPATAPPAIPIAAPANPNPAPRAPIVLPPTKDDGPWDHSWLARLDRAKHKLVFDIGAYQNGGGLYYAKNYLNGMRDGWGVDSPEMLPFLGISGDAYPLVFRDEVWARYRYGASSKTTDPRTKEPAIRNVFWHPRAGEPMAEFGVDVLQGRGCQFFLCNNVYRGVIRGVMRESGRPYAEVRAELTAGLLPGVIVVPAMVAAMAMAQSHGAGYVFAGA